MTKKKTRTSTVKVAPLERMLKEISWLERTRDDDTVTVTEWRRRGNKLLEDAAQLQGRDQDKFHAAWAAYQAREGVVIPQEATTEVNLDQESVDAEAARRIRELLEQEGVLR